MTQIKIGVIMENAARISGRDVLRLGVPDGWKPLAAMSINAGMSRIIAEKFPMMTRVEIRQYRPTWDPSVTYSVGHEVWWADNYWRLESAALGAPDASGGPWKKLEMSELPAFIAWDQPWENTVIHRAGVDPQRFAYSADPKYYPDATPVRSARVTSFGIELASPAPQRVFCRFVPEFPRITFDEWSSGSAYDPGDVVYVTQHRDCFVCLHKRSAGSLSPIEDSDGWVPVRIPAEFEPFLVRLVACEFLTTDQGKQQSSGAAEQEFNRLCETYHEGNGETQVRRGRFM